MFDLLPLGDISLTSLIEQVFPQRSQFLIIVPIRTESLKNIHPRLTKKERGGARLAVQKKKIMTMTKIRVPVVFILEKSGQRAFEPFRFSLGQVHVYITLNPI